MTEKEIIFDENCKKYGGIFLEYKIEDGKEIMNKIEIIRKKLNDYYHDKTVLCILPDEIKEIKVKNTNPDAKNNHPYVNVYCANSTQINAFVKKIGEDYYLGIMKGVFDKIYTHIEQYVLDAEFEKVPEIGKVIPKRMVNILTEYCFDYLIFHEFFHIMNGHCDYVSSMGIGELCEASEEVGKNNMIRQTLEYDADCCAVTSIVNEYFRSSKITIPGMSKLNGRMNINSVIQFISGLFISVYIFTTWMNVHRCDGEITKKQLERMTHPLPGMRVFYMWETIDTALQKIPFYSDNEKEEILRRSLDALTFFIDRFKDIAYPGYIKQSLNEVGKQHLQEIHDNWKVVREKLVIHYNDLAPYTQIDIRDMLERR